MGYSGSFYPRGTDLSVHSQAQLDEIAYLQNIRPRKHFDWQCLIEMMTEVIGKYHTYPASIQ